MILIPADVQGRGGRSGSTAVFRSGFGMSNDAEQDSRWLSERSKVLPVAPSEGREFVRCSSERPCGVVERRNRLRRQRRAQGFEPSGVGGCVAGTRRVPEKLCCE